MERLDIDDWEQLRTFLEEPAAGGAMCYWRGQRDPEWPLAASLERTILSWCGDPVDPETYRALARRHLEVFKVAASGIRGASPKDLSEEQWWALGRHYGLETPLLDWTEKPYIALFFALRGGGPVAQREPPSRSECFAMYRLTHTAELASEDLRVVKTPIDELGRMQQQRGVFTWNQSTRFFDLGKLLDDTGRGALLTQARVSARLIPRALRDLELHGIDHRQLFPDMYGAARHANVLLATDPVLRGNG